MLITKKEKREIIARLGGLEDSVSKINDRIRNIEAALDFGREVTSDSFLGKLYIETNLLKEYLGVITKYRFVDDPLYPKPPIVQKKEWYLEKVNTTKSPKTKKN